jgi:hypothetical protein
MTGVESRWKAWPAALLVLAAPAELEAPEAELAALPDDRLEPDADADPDEAPAEAVGRTEPDTGVVEAPEVELTETVELVPDRSTTGAAVTKRLFGSTPFEMVE